MADRVREPFWNVPNSLTMSRLVMAFAVFAFIAQAYYLSALVFFGILHLVGRWPAPSWGGGGPSWCWGWPSWSWGVGGAVLGAGNPRKQVR